MLHFYRSVGVSRNMSTSLTLSCYFLRSHVCRGCKGPRACLLAHMGKQSSKVCARIGVSESPGLCVD